MTELKEIFCKLSEHLKHGFIWEDIEEMYEDAQKDKDHVDDANNSNSAKRHCKQLRKIGNFSLDNCPLLEKVFADDDIISNLLDLCSTIRSLRMENGASSDSDSGDTNDSWDELVQVIPRDGYLAFIYALAGLTKLSTASVSYIKLAIYAVNVYFLSLTIAGAKSFHILEEDIIIHCLQVFNQISEIQNVNFTSKMNRRQITEIWTDFATLCDDLKLVLNSVHFIEHEGVRDTLLRKLINIQRINHEKGYANIHAANLHQKCYEIYEEIMNNGKQKDTLLKLMNMTVFLHVFNAKPKCLSGGPLNVNYDCEHISDWFIKCIAKYPDLMVNALSFYIECILTNPVKSWRTEQVQKALEYAAKYDAALFIKCKTSCLQFICNAIYADEVMIRSRTVELIAKILQLNSYEDWETFRNELSEIPRELYFIKELIDSIQDQNNNIKLKATQALSSALTKGSIASRTILSECIKFAVYSDENVILPEEPKIEQNEIRFEKPTIQEAHYTFNGHELVEDAILKLPNYIFMHLFRNPLSYIRRCGVMFIEQLVKLNPLIIFNTNLVDEFTKLINEPTALVRKQCLVSLDAILEYYPNCYPIVWIWCKTISPMLHDADSKNTELAMQCFHSRVLLNIRDIDKSDKAEHFMPWIIIRTMLTTQSRLYLQNCFHLALQKSMVSEEVVRTIESHLLTSYSTEAWVVLNFISGKMTSSEPDALIHRFISLESWNKEQNMLIALEVLANCVKDFSPTALKYVFQHILSSIKDGELLPNVVGKAFDFLLLIANCSQTNQKQQQDAGDTEVINKDWIEDLHEYLQQEIIEGIAHFPDNSSVFMCRLYAYTEVNLQTRIAPDEAIISFIHKFIADLSKLNERDYNLENERLFNSMILLIGRLSLRDSCVARVTCSLYANILKNLDRPPIVNTILVILSDLCKKHAQIIENMIDIILHKLKSAYEINRIETFKCLEKLVLQDQVKLRGSILLYLLSALLDISDYLSQRATQFFTEYLDKKNPTLFEKCLIECPFVLNEYRNFDALDGCNDIHIKSPIKGNDLSIHRQQLYEYFLKSINKVHMIMYFGQLKLLAEKSQHDPLMKSPQGIAVIKDIFYILKRICHLTKEKKSVDADNAEENSENRDEDNTLIEMSNGVEENKNTTKNTSQNQTNNNSSMGRGRKRREISMADALTMLEKFLVCIHTIHSNVIEVDETIQTSVDDLCKALAKRFPNMVEFAQPPEFWKKYIKAKVVKITSTPKNKTKQMRQRAKSKGTDKGKGKDKDKEKEKEKEEENGIDKNENNENNDKTIDATTDVESIGSDDDDDSDSDNSTCMHLTSKRICLPIENQTENNLDDGISMEYIFKPYV